MDLKDFLGQLSKLSPEEKQQLAQVMGLPAAPAKPEEPVRQKNPPAVPLRGRVYFFEQLMRFGVTEITKAKDQDTLVKNVDVLPSRIIAVDEKMAWRLYWKQRNRYRYLGRSNGEMWRHARSEGKSVAEAQKMEYDEMLKAPDMTAPTNREKTVFAGRKLSQLERGVEVSWEEGLRGTNIKT